MGVYLAELRRAAAQHLSILELKILGGNGGGALQFKAIVWRFPSITLHGVCEHRGGLYVRRFGHETVEKLRICPFRVCINRLCQRPHTRLD